MSQQALDLATSLKVARRHKILISVLAGLGLLLGCAYTLMNPPKATSEALIILPQLASSGASAASGNGTTTSDPTATQVVVAGSDTVLAGALPHITPSMSLQQLRGAVQVKSLAGTVIAIDGHSTSPAQAVSIANAVANSYVAYVSSAASPVGQMTARVLQSAGNPTGDTLLQRLLPYGLLGALAGLLIGFVSALAIGRNPRKLRDRDAIANSLGIPVIAAVPVSHPADANGWTKLLDEYEPSVVHAWQLRRMLDQLGIAEARSGTGQSRVSSLAVLSLSSDKKALALGPQLASFAAALGIRTALVVGQQQDPAVAATLHAACAVPPHAASSRRRPLRTLAADYRQAIDTAGATLVVVVVVVDGQAPRMPETMRTGLTILGVSAGVATAEELARVATVAVADGRDITGILVADPEPSDRTTGRVPQLGRAAQRRLPSRTQGIPTESRR